ncbi:HIT family protein [Xylanimonas protaetiae]|uniref:HIT family protein n=1 Tax=Xylanimonas protaetiae TaxID=2509457 RepID=A0A4P6F470_9MICO|nr:HIT family protein [Xylanimonas protaetiae]QAY69483.1 HIT family protein [Xylanimonas protaetiae]
MSQAESNLTLPQDGRCAFCDYLSGARPYTVLSRDDLVAVLVTREQRGIGHLLVLPVRHCPTLLEATEPERHALIDTIARAAHAVDEAFARPGIAVWQNNGTAAHQAIGHLHFHVAGTLPGGGTDFGDVPELSVEATDLIGERIRKGARRAGSWPL